MKSAQLIALLLSLLLISPAIGKAVELTDGMVVPSPSTPGQVDLPEHSYLSGDTRLACEAVLCLSSGHRPSECSPSLNRYFGIHHKKWKNTVKARRNFLRLCPSATADSQMESLVEVIVNGAGRCNASELNRSHWTYMPKRICRDIYDSERGYYTYCYNVETRVVNPQLPSYCTNYNAHGYTYEVGVHYVGDPLEGGHWVDDSTE